MADPKTAESAPSGCDTSCTGIRRGARHPRCYSKLLILFSLIGRGQSTERRKIPTLPHLESGSPVTVPHLGSGLSVRADVLGLDFVDDALLTWLSERVLVFVQVFFCELVDELIRTLVRDLAHATTYLEIAVGIVGIDERNGHPRIATDVLVFHPSNS